MSWIEDHVSKVVGVVFTIIFAVVGAMMWASSTTEPAAPIQNPVTSSTEERNEGPSRDPRTGTTPPDFLVSFVEKLNEVNTYVATQEQSQAEERDLYQQLWEWGSNGGLTLTGRDKTGKVFSKTSKDAARATLLDIVTVEGFEYCAVAVGLLDPARSDEPIQALLNSSCADIIVN
jgi:hypothetical protein